MNIPQLQTIQTELDGLLLAQKANCEEATRISLVLPTIHLTTPNPIWVELFELLYELFENHDHIVRYSSNIWTETVGYAERRVTVTLPAEVAAMLPRLMAGNVIWIGYVFPVCMPTVFVLTADDWSSFQGKRCLLLASFGVILEFLDHKSDPCIQNMSPHGPWLCLPKK